MYGPYKAFVGRDLTFIEKIRCKYFSPEGNSVYLVRRMMYLNSIRGGGIFAQFIRNKLAHKYGIYIHPSAKIGLGLKIYHPTSIVITSAEIGKDFTIYQNCTIGRKGNDTGDDVMPKIGNNVKMFSGSCIIGGITVCDNVILAANACLVKNASESGVYAGVPAKKIK